MTNFLRRLFGPSVEPPVRPAGPHLLHVIEWYLLNHGWSRWTQNQNLWRLDNRDLYSFRSAIETQIRRDGDEVPTA